MSGPIPGTSRRFGLSAAFLACAILALLLVGAAWWWRSHDISVQVWRAGGQFESRDREAKLIDRFARWIHDQPAYVTHRVNFWHAEVDDNWLGDHREGLASLSHLSLNFGGTPMRITDAGLRHLHGLDNIESLAISGGTITNAGFESLLSLRNLYSLQIAKTAITDDELAKLSQIPRLQYLAVDRAQLTERGVAALLTCPMLNQIMIEDADDETAILLQAWKNLRSLTLTGRSVTDRSVSALSALTGLEQLALFDTSVSDDGLDTLRTALPTCNIIRTDPPTPPVKVRQ